MNDVLEEPKDIRDSQSYLFISIPLIEGLDNFTKRLIYLQIKIHKRVSPICTKSVWCHSSVVKYNCGIMIPIISLSKISLEKLEITIELHSKHLRSSYFIGSCNLCINNIEEKVNNDNGLIYFFKRDSFSLFNEENAQPVCNLLCTVAIGHNEDASEVDTPTSFDLVPIHYINNKKKERNPLQDSVSYVEDNWGTFSKLHEIVDEDNELQKSDIIRLELSPPRKHPLVEASKLSRTQPILSPCITPIKEIDSILDEDIDTEISIDRFIQKKLIQSSVNFETPKRFSTPSRRSKKQESPRLDSFFSMNRSQECFFSPK